MFRLNKKQSITQPNNSPITTVLGSEITFTGEIQGNQSIKIDGKVIGNINIENVIILGEKAIVEGDMKSKSMIIYGQVLGNILCKEIILKKSGSIDGDIITDAIEIEMGGKYNGKLRMNTVQKQKKETEK